MLMFKRFVFFFFFSSSFSLGSFVKRSGDLIPNPGGSSNPIRPSQTPPVNPNTPEARLQEQNGRRNPVDRPPELPSSHPIGPPTLPEVRYEEDRQRPNLFQRLTGIKGKGKKRTRYEMENDHEAGTSGTKHKKPKASAEDVHNFLNKIVEDRNEESRRNNRRYRYQSPQARRLEREHWKEVVGGGLVAAGTGMAIIYNAGKKVYNDVKQACVGACKRIDQSFQRHFERQGWSEPSQPLRSDIQRYRPNENPPRPGSLQSRRGFVQQHRKRKEEKKKAAAEQIKKQQDVPANQQQPSSVSRSRLRTERSQSAPPTFRSKNTLDRSFNRSHSSPF